MRNIEQAKRTARENLKFVVESLDKAAGFTSDEVVKDFFVEAVEGVEEAIETAELSTPEL